jgi:hypothetical protein
MTRNDSVRTAGTNESTRCTAVSGMLFRNPPLPRAVGATAPPGRLASVDYVDAMGEVDRASRNLVSAVLPADRTAYTGRANDLPVA